MAREYDDQKKPDQPKPQNDEKGRVIKEDRRDYDGTVQPSTVGEGQGERPPKPRQ